MYVTQLLLPGSRQPGRNVDKLAVVLLTYGRYEYAARTLRSTLDRLYTKFPICVHIASDGDDEEYVGKLRKIAGGYKEVEGVVVTNSERGGYGRNVNLAMQVYHQHARWALMLEDDWELTRDLHIDGLLEVLDTAPTIGCVRLGYAGFTQPLRGTIERWLGQHFLVFDPASEEPHVFAGHPRVEAVAWQKEVGTWPEGLPPGMTEFYVATKLENARKRVAWPLDLVRMSGDLYAHIGTTRSY